MPTVKEIKAGKWYKNLPPGHNKSKLKLAELLALMEKSKSAPTLRKVTPQSKKREVTPQSKKSKVDTTAKKISNEILSMDALMDDPEYYERLVDDTGLWTRTFSKLFRLLIQLRDMDPDMYDATESKLKISFADIGYGQDEDPPEEDRKLYNQLYVVE